MRIADGRCPDAGPDPACAEPMVLARRGKDFYHSVWSSEAGLGAVFDIQQAPNGYLWLTTSKGVLRFDGVKFQSIEEVTNGAIQNNDVLSAFVYSSGHLWLTTRRAGFLVWKNGQLSVFPDRRCTPTAQMGGVGEGQDGSL